MKGAAVDHFDSEFYVTAYQRLNIAYDLGE